MPLKTRSAIIWPASLVFTCASSLCFAESPKRGNPEDHLPSNITQLTGFGERAAWSPDGKRIAFMAKSFKDAFEIQSGDEVDSPSDRPLLS